MRLPSLLIRQKTSKYSSRGFTLVELLVASGLLFLAMSITMRFLYDFNDSSNRLLVQSQMEEKLRNALNRIEYEIQEGAQVLIEHPTQTSIKTNHSNLVLSVPIYNASGFIVYDNNGSPQTDTMVMQIETDLQAASYLERSKTAGSEIRPEQLKFFMTTNQYSERHGAFGAGAEQIIIDGLMPKDNAGLYKHPSGSTVTAVATFRYFTAAGAAVTTFPLSATDAQSISQVRVTLWAEVERGADVDTSKKEIDIRLRNWDPVP